VNSQFRICIAVDPLSIAPMSYQRIGAQCLALTALLLAGLAGCGAEPPLPTVEDAAKTPTVSPAAKNIDSYSNPPPPPR